MAFDLKQGEDLIDRLSTEKLEKLVGANIDIDHAPDDILRWHLYAIAKLYHRYKNGERTTTDKWKAYHFSKKIAELTSHARLIAIEHSEELNIILEEAKSHRPPTNFWSTGIFYTFFTWYTQWRLTTTRTNRLLSLLEKAFLPAWFAIAGLLFGLELLLDIIVLCKATFSPKTSQEKKLGVWDRFILALFKDNRITRMANAALWFGINLACFIIPFVLAGSVVVLGIPMTIPFIIGGLTLCGGILDIFIDAGGGIYALKQEHELLNDLNTLDNSDDELTGIKNSLKNKKNETLISRFFRVLNNDIIMAASMFLIFFPPTTLIAAVIIGSKLAFITAEFIANCTLPNTRVNTFDKVRLGIVFTVLAAALLLVLFPPAGLALTLPIIGAGIVVCVGTLGFARRIFTADTSWVRDKASLVWNKITGWFDLGPSLALDLVENIPPPPAPHHDNLPKAKSEDPIAPSLPKSDQDLPLEKIAPRSRSNSYSQSSPRLFVAEAPVDESLPPIHPNAATMHRSPSPSLEATS